MRIEQLSATEVLDSRGQPTLHVTLRTGTGVVTSAGVPSGASTGAKEAVELRDGDPARYAGRGVQQAAGSITGPLTQALGDREWATLGELDAALCAADGTPNKSSLGANAIVGVSMAAARGFAAEAGQPLFRYLAAEGGGPGPRLPRRAGCCRRWPSRQVVGGVNRKAAATLRDRRRTDGKSGAGRSPGS